MDDDSAFVHFVSFQMLKKAFYNTDIMKFLGGVKLIDSNYCNIYMGVGLYPPQIYSQIVSFRSEFTICGWII